VCVYVTQSICTFHATVFIKGLLWNDPITGIDQVWLEYIFGICKPDGRIGKAGSRSVAICEKWWALKHLTETE
jgi:hypothetical protein